MPDSSNLDIANYLDDSVLEAVLKRLNALETPEIVNSMSEIEILRAYLEWHGIIGYESMIYDAICNIEAAFMSASIDAFDELFS